MNATTITIFVIVDLIIVMLILSRIFRRISRVQARILLKSGATVLDVRSPEEFQSGHLKGAVNVPYQEVGARIATIVPDKSRPVLVYCLSGGRSGIAKSALRRRGYRQAHNLGSLKRVRSIVEG